MPKITARLANPFHPNGQHVRGGVTWTREWATHDLAAADRTAVREDIHLEVKSANTPDADAGATSAAPDYNALKARAAELGLSTKGKKAEIAERIAEYEKANPAKPVDLSTLDSEELVVIAEQEDVDLTGLDPAEYVTAIQAARDGADGADD